MKKWSVLSTILASLILGFSGNLWGADATFDVTANSAYVWRGITFNDGAVLQPSLDVTKGGFGMNVWGNYDLDDYDDTLDNGQFSEIDLTLSYGFAIKSVDMSVGYIEYLFPNASPALPAGREVFVTCGVEPIKGLSLGLAVYYEIDEVEDIYASISAAYGYSISEALSVEIGVSAGYVGKDYSVVGEAGMNDICASLSASYAVNEALGVTAGIYYADTLDEDVLPEQDVTTYGGIGASYTF
ncbi:MAG: MltA-interacting MipA family protein [Proteobacteria bacterium]|nr:MltA-interacting MipA family protein [Pseudomonadota bacterium]